MIEQYRFKARLKNEGTNLALELGTLKKNFKSRFQRKYPLAFTILTIPLLTDSPNFYTESWEHSFFLDFQNSVNELGENYWNIMDKSRNQRRIILGVEELLGPLIAKCLNSGTNQLVREGEIVELWNDNGLTPYYPTQRVGNPKRKKKYMGNGKAGQALRGD